MFQLIGTKVILIIAGILSIIIFVLWCLFIPLTGEFSLLSRVIKSVTFVATSITLLGQALPIIPWIARKPFVRKYLGSYMPDIDGNWRARSFSNWPNIADAFQLQNEAEEYSYADIKITVRLLTIRMEFDGDTDYSVSDTVMLHAARDPVHGDISLHYIYDDRVSEALRTDSGQHYGAANLRIKSKNEKHLYLEGHYWTNRNWEKGWNTAGRIKMWRTDDPDSEANMKVD